MLDLYRTYVGICGQAASKLVQKSVTRQQSVYVRVGISSETADPNELKFLGMIPFGVQMVGIIQKFFGSQSSAL